MRTYGQHCGLARALDVVGDRWTMLLLRELAIRPCRYRDLRDGLPGIATNLLADRLRQLETDGVVDRTEAPPPVGATVYQLTPLGRRLIPVLLDLATWGASWMKSKGALDGPGTDFFRARWLVMAVASLLRDPPAGTPDFRARIDVDDEAVAFEVRDGSVSASIDLGGPVDLVVTTTPEGALALVTGQMSPDELVVKGLAEIDGEAWVVKALGALTSTVQRRISVVGDTPEKAVAAYLGYAVPAGLRIEWSEPPG